MHFKASRYVFVIFALTTIPFADARATDGHFLHGVGAVNSAMGGAGVASPQDLLGAFYVNPAGLMAFEATRVDLGFELFRPDRELSSSAGPMSGSTKSSSSFVPIPAFGFSTRLANRNVVVGLGGFGVGGFGVNYPVDPANPILAPRPFGFGQIYSNFQLLKITPAIAAAVGDRLWLGFSANIDWASLAVDPFPAASPAADPGPDGKPGTRDDRAFYSTAAASDGAFGMGFQAGLIYKAAENISVGASYTSKQLFHDFIYNSSFANPNLPNFGLPRTIRFALDLPAVTSAGVAFRPNPSLLLAGDFRYIQYENTDGFRESGFAPDGRVLGFGWKNIPVVAAGAQLQTSKRSTLRFGYNYAGNPIPDDLSMFNAPAPAIVQHHATVGAGFNVTSTVALNAGYYHAFRNSITGPFQTPGGPAPGTSVTNSLQENSFLLQFSIGARKER